MNKILHLNLYRKYFDEIANGTKTIEYRDKTNYWKKRIEHKEYDVIKFRNGYAKNAPTMLVEYKKPRLALTALIQPRLKFVVLTK